MVSGRMPAGSSKRRGRDPFVLSALGSLVITGAIVVWLAPAERTIGEGIKFVYVHVALTLSGALCFVLAGLLGLVLLFFGDHRTRRWMLPVGWAGLALFAAGTLTSLIAAKVNWGAVFAAEPLLRVSLLVLAVGLICLCLTGFTERPRIRGFLSLIPGLTLVGLWAGSPLVLHPDSLTLTGSASGFGATFAILTVLCLVGAALVIREATR